MALTVGPIPQECNVSNHGIAPHDKIMHCCCINKPVIFSHCVHLKLGHRFHVLLKVCSDRDDYCLDLDFHVYTYISDLEWCENSLVGDKSFQYLYDVISNSSLVYKNVTRQQIMWRKFNDVFPVVLWSVVVERSSALDSSSGVARMWVRIPAWPVVALVSLSKTLNHNCFVLRMGRKAVGPVCCVMHVKEPRTLIMKEKGLAPVFLERQPNAPKALISMFRVCIV